MTGRDEDYLFECVEELMRKTHEHSVLLRENNDMLRQIIHVVNTYLANHDKENEDDFGRNVLANIVSNILDCAKFRG